MSEHAKRAEGAPYDVAAPRTPRLRKAHWSDDPRLRAEAELQDARHALKDPLPDKIRRMTADTVLAYQSAIARAALPPAEKRWFLLVLAQTDGHTHVCYRHRMYLVREAGTDERRARKVTTRFVQAGIWKRVRLDRHHPNLRPGTTEYREGCWLLEWQMPPGKDLDAALAVMSKWLEDPGGGGGVGGPFRPPTRGSIPTPYPGVHSDPHPGGPNRSPPPSVGCLLNLDTVSLGSDACLNPHSPLSSSLKGDPKPSPPEQIKAVSATPTRVGFTATPGHDVAPAAPRLPSQHETAPPGREAVERGDCKVRTAVGRPGAAQAPESASARPSPMPQGALEEIDRIVTAAVATGLQRWPGPLRELFAGLYREGVSLETLDELVVGVEFGQGEAAAARAAHMPFAYACASAENLSLYAHAGRKHREAEGPPPAVRARLASLAAGSAPAAPKKNPTADPAAFEAARQDAFDALMREDFGAVEKAQRRMALFAD
jgi:hypothetical protein